MHPPLSNPEDPRLSICLRQIERPRRSSQPIFFREIGRPRTDSLPIFFQKIVRSGCRQAGIRRQSTGLSHESFSSPFEIFKKRSPSQKGWTSFLATPNGLEPSTSSVTGWRANRLHHRAKLNGGNNRARTCDPMLVRHVLSQLSYAPEFRIWCCSPQRHDTLYTWNPVLSSTFFNFFSRNFSIHYSGVLPPE